MALLRATAPTTAVLLLAAALVLATCSSGAGGCEGNNDDGAGHFLRHSLIGCAPPTPSTQAAGLGDGPAFQAALAKLLAALPSAAAPTGFASLRSAGAHALGLCFGRPERCLGCLSVTAAAVTEVCASDTLRAAAWRDGCLLAYAADEDAGVDGAFEFPAGGDTRDQVLADLARALAETKGKSLWNKALSVIFYALAAVGAITIVLLLCAFIAIFKLVETLRRISADISAAGHHAAAGQGQAGEGVTAYVVATNGQ